VGYRSRGFIELEDLRREGFVPPRDVVEGKVVAVSECIEEIPCNVCQSLCPVKAIRVEGLRGRPKVDWARCTGCGICVGGCPGQAMFLVGRDGDGYLVGLPYEFLPRPKKGDVVELLNRRGEPVGRGEVLRVFDINKTLVVLVRVSGDLIWEVRSIRVK